MPIQYRYGAGGTLFEINSLTRDASYFNPSGNCGQVMSDGYHIANRSCNTSIGDFFTFVFEVKMTINQGDCGGMNLRVYVGLGFGDAGPGYTFYVCSDGTYQFLVTSSSSSTILKSGSNSGIVSGQNIIAVVASGSIFTLYLNHTRLGSVSDSTYSYGGIGLIAGSTNSNANNVTEVTYRDVRIWTI